MNEKENNKAPESHAINSGNLKADKIAVISALILYAVSGLIFLPFYRYCIDPDGIAYICIADKYANGFWADAINSYWSPMFSWLLAPFLKAGIEGLLASKILTFITGFFAIFAFWLILKQIKSENVVRYVFLFASIPITLNSAYFYGNISPDLLLAVFFLFYFLIIMKKDFGLNKFDGLLCGFLGGMAYLTKAYGLYFFVVHYFTAAIIHYMRYETPELKKKVLKHFILGIALFAIISGLWGTILGSKYGRFTFGSTGRLNLYWRRPGTEGKLIFPMFYYGLLEPPNKTAITMWEDPGLYPAGTWSPFQDGESFKYYIIRVLSDLDKMMFLYNKFTIFAISIMTIFLLFCIQPPGKIKEDFLNLLIMSAFLLFSIGYVAVLVEMRYLWFSYYLLVIMAVIILSLLLKNSFFTRIRKFALIAIVALSFIYLPTDLLLRHINMNKNLYEFAGVLKSEYNIRGNIASNTTPIYGQKGFYWNNILAIAYHLNVKYYGMNKENLTYGELKRNLEENNINYYFVWNNSPHVEDLNRDYKEITGGKYTILKIFRIVRK